MSTSAGPEIVDPYRDTHGIWAAFFGAGWKWRWFTFPHLYYPPGLKFNQVDPFCFHDCLGRTPTFTKPFDCTISPASGKLKTLYVQATDSVCRLSSTNPNCTWKRTPIRNVSPWSLRISNMAFRLIPPERRNDSKLYTSNDRMTVALMWIPTIIALFFAMLIDLAPQNIKRPLGKTNDSYIDLPYGNLRFPRLARSYKENRRGVIDEGHATPAWSLAASGNYRTYRPKYLFFIREIKNADGSVVTTYERRAVNQRDHDPYVFISWSWAHYHVRRPGLLDEQIDEGARQQLFSSALQAAMCYYSTAYPGESLDGKAYWLSQGCLSSTHTINPSGELEELDPRDQNFAKLRREEANKDTYSMSDIVRAAEHVIVLSWSGTDWDPNAERDYWLRIWGKQVWTLLEVVLSKGDTVSVSHMYLDANRTAVVVDAFETISKAEFPFRAWGDHQVARQLLENYTNVHLSRLELTKIALEAIMSREFRQAYPGDRTYVLMGLTGTRPPIDRADTSFQAFARMSFPQDNDKIIERLICLLPKVAEEDWELMTDQYESSLWDIYPDMNVCAVGENDTVVIDGARGCQIQWDTFTNLETLGRKSFKRRVAAFIVRLMPLTLLITLILTAFVPPAVILLVLVLLFVVLPSPVLVWRVFGGKLWHVEPALFGIEGFVPVEVVESMLFGVRMNRMKWSAFGSPLSRHVQGDAVLEREASSVGGWSEPPGDQKVNTYPIVPVSPCATCEKCSPLGSRFTACNDHETYISCQQKSHSRMGELKVFTLVDTLNMEVTIFHAVRPPTTLIVGATEGGMKRAIACSLDMTTGTLYRETVLRLPSQCVNGMYRLPRIRLGLRRPFHPSFVSGWQDSAPSGQPYIPPGQGWGQSGYPMRQFSNTANSGGGQPVDA